MPTKVGIHATIRKCSENLRGPRPSAGVTSRVRSKARRSNCSAVQSHWSTCSNHAPFIALSDTYTIVVTRNAGALILGPVHPTILQIIPALDTGGAELSTVEIAHAIVAAGGRALVATTGGRLAAKIIEVGGEIIPFPAATKNPARMLANARALSDLIRREHVDLVHARSRAPAWSAFSAARATKRPFITTYHGAYAEKGAFKRAYNSVMARGDFVIANSAFTAALIQSRYDTPADRLRIIHRGVDAAAYDRNAVDEARRDALRSTWGIAPGTRVILHPARLTRWKGQTVVIEALARLELTCPANDWVAVFAGDDQGRTDYTQELQRQIGGRDVADRVRLVGHVDDMAAAFSLATVSLIASIEPEAFGRTAIEAQIMGSPVIATRLGAPSETVRAGPEYPADDRTGWLIPPADPQALTEALAACLKMSEVDRKALAARAAEHAKTNFSLDRMKLATLAVYDEALGTSLTANFTAGRTKVVAANTK
jgi:glycosyltransferase involved in cell wall biosynthesis